MKRILLVIVVVIGALSLFTTIVQANPDKNPQSTDCNSNNEENCPEPPEICGNGWHTGNPHCVAPTPEPEVSPTPEPTATATATATPTAEPEPTATATPTAEPEPTATATPTAAPEPTATATPTAAPEPTATATPTAEPESTTPPEPTVQPTETPPTGGCSYVSGLDEPGEYRCLQGPTPTLAQTATPSLPVIPQPIPVEPPVMGTPEPDRAPRTPMRTDKVPTPARAGNCGC